MHTKFFKFLGATLLGLGAASICFAAAQHIDKDSRLADASVGSYSTSISSYYSSSSTQYSGTQLLGQLHDLITSTHKTYTTYDDNGKNLYQQNTDQWYDASGNKVSGYLRDFYSGVKWPNAWAATAGNTSGGYNREHVWCQSLSVPSGSSSQLWGTTGGGADMHHLRPTEVRINSTRNNHLYGEVGSSRDSYKVYSKLGTNTTYALGGYYYNDVFEPIDSVKGDVARIVFYVYTHYNSYSVSAAFGSYGSTNGSGSSSYFASSELPITNLVSGSESAAWSMLLEWNESDPVDSMEMKRNNQVATYQGNRNPFIDYPDLAKCCWGSSKWNWSTRSIYGSSSSGSGSGSGDSGSSSGGSSSGSSSSTTSGSEYSIVFSTNSSDSSSALSTSTLLSSAVSSNSLVSSVSSVSRAYKGKSGLKLGTSRYVGSFTAVPVSAAKSNVSSIKITSTKYSSDTGTLTLSVNGSSVKTGITVGSDYTYSFSSAASVSSFGIATSAKRAYVGSVTFVIGSSSSSGSSSGSTTVTDSVSLNKSSLSLEVGDYQTLTATASGSVTWSTSNSSVATVSSGKVTAKAAGSATITATCGSASAKCYVTVTEPEVTYSVSLNKSSLALEVGDYETLTATASDSVTWSTSNSSVATVSSGKVTAKAAGTATITATCGTATATCKVTVTEPETSSSNDYHFANGTAYKMYYTRSSRNYYFTGSMYYSYYGRTSTTKSSGVNVYFEADGEGQNLYFLNSSGAKQYLYIYVSGSYPYFGVSSSEPSNVWTYSSSYGCMTMTVSGSVYTFAGYYSYFDAYAIGSASYRVNFVA